MCSSNCPRAPRIVLSAAVWPQCDVCCAPSAGYAPIPDYDAADQSAAAMPVASAVPVAAQPVPLAYNPVRRQLRPPYVLQSLLVRFLRGVFLEAAATAWRPEAAKGCYKGIPSFPSNVTRDHPHSLLMLQGTALIPF